jgi:RNA polymerase sigma factor (sigma-70 family)
MIDRDQINLLGTSIYKNRDEHSFQEFYLHFNPLIRNYVWKNFSSIANQIDDIQCSFFSAVWEHIDQYDPTQPFSGWVSGILKNECLRRLRSSRPNGKKAMTLGDSPIEDQKNLGENNIENWINDEYENFTIDALNNALDNLPEVYRNIFLDKYLNLLTVEEIAAKYGWNLNTVKTRIRDSIFKLKKLLYPNADPRQFRISRNGASSFDPETGNRLNVARRRKRKMEDYEWSGKRINGKLKSSPKK